MNELIVGEKEVQVQFWKFRLWNRKKTLGGLLGLCSMYQPWLMQFSYFHFLFLLQLLGKECYDIDIALDDMLGREFCDKVNEYLSSKGEEIHGIGVIQWWVIPQICNLASVCY